MARRVAPGAEQTAPVDGLVLRSTAGRVALTATVAASSMAMLDATVVNVALPHIGEDLNASVSSLQWVLTGYLLALASLILLGGALGDRYGRRKVFVIGTVWFAVASLLCGAAPNVEVLVGARVLQGVGAALLTPGSLAILQAVFVEADRAKAVGAWSGLGGVAGALGPFVGGWLVDGPGWRWAFLINLPVAALAVACALYAVPETRDPHATRALDVVGAGLAVISLGAATWALTEAGPRGWTDPAVIGAGIVALVGIAAFVRRMRRTEDPLVPPSLFRSREFTVTNVATVLLYSAIGVSFFLVSYELQVGAGWSALAAGTALAAGHAAHAPALGQVRRAGAAHRAPSPAHRRPADPRRRPAPADPHRSRRVVGPRRAAGRDRPRPRARDVRGAAHRHRHGLGERRPRQRGVGGQQRDRPDREPGVAVRDPGRLRAWPKRPARPT